MALIVSDVSIARPPDEVCSGCYRDPSRFGEWQSCVVSGRIEAGGPPGVGSNEVPALGQRNEASRAEVAA